MRIAGLLLLFGLVIGTALVAWFGAGAVATTLLTIGWGGFLAVCGFHILLIVLNGLAWWVLTPDVAPRRWWMFVWARLVRTAAAEILPLSQLGGPVAGIRLTMLHGIPGGVAAAAVIVDVALEFLTQLAYAVLGLALLAARGSGTDLLLPAAAWVVVAAGLCAGFIVVQRRGGGLVEKLSPFIAKRFSAGLPISAGLPGAMESVTAALARIYARRAALAVSTFLHLIEWLATGVEAWLALRFMNVPVSLASATGIEALLYAVRSAAFMVPVAAGIQEGGYLLVGAAFGLTPDQALALSLLKRGRDVALGILPLAGWQILESRRWWQRSAAAGESTEPGGRTGD